MFLSHTKKYFARWTSGSARTVPGRSPLRAGQGHPEGWGVTSPGVPGVVLRTRTKRGRYPEAKGGPSFEGSWRLQVGFLVGMVHDNQMEDKRYVGCLSVIAFKRRPKKRLYSNTEMFPVVR